MYHAKTATVRDLRNCFGQISRWLDAGETVKLTKRGKGYARIVPVNEQPVATPPKIDFAARVKEMFGDRVFTDEEIDRARYGALREWEKF